MGGAPASDRGEVGAGARLSAAQGARRRLRQRRVIVTREHGYELTLDPERLDARPLRAAGRRGTARAGGGPTAERAAAALEEALSLWRGRPLDDLAYEPFAQHEIARLEELRLAALEQLIEAKLALGRHAELVAQLEPLIAEHPYRERLRAQLMLALYRCERQADALQAYQDARRALVEELGIEPGERLRELERAILAQDPALGRRRLGRRRRRRPSTPDGFADRGRHLPADRHRGLVGPVGGRCRTRWRPRSSCTTG